MIQQHIIKEGETGTILTLSEFTEKAIQILKQQERIDEVVILADALKELKEDHITPPRDMHPLPEGFKYRFSGFYGHVIGIIREGVIQ